MINILELNNRYLQVLKESRKRDPSLTFTFRKSNYAGRLSEGFWFYGTESYLGISFWSGMDWKNRTPNIMLRVRENGDIDLEVNISDSDRKREFVERHLVKELKLNQFGRRFMRSIATNCNEESAVQELRSFLKNLKRRIDEIIRKAGKSFFSEQENPIGFISEEEFRETEMKVDEYYYKLQNASLDEERLRISKPTKISSYTISNYGPIDFVQLLDIPLNTQWIFITGENGCGKTNFLRSLAATLGNHGLGTGTPNKVPRSEIELFFKDGSTERLTTTRNAEVKTRKFMVSGLCMYGPYRLKSTRKLRESTFRSLFNKKNAFKSLFTDTGHLLDLETQFEIWQRRADTQDFLEKRKYYIRNAVIDIVPGLVDIRFSNDPTDKETRYVTRKSEDADEQLVLWDQLASGTRSVLSLLADIMLRLYHQQPKVVDASELNGVVIIDEIDLHLHPIAQKRLIENLTKCFPEVQFVATTHSPIPLLGAPQNSRIYVMQKTAESIEMVRMDDKVPFSRILPNGLLSSPIFGLEDLVPVSKDEYEIPFAEETFSEISFLNRLEREVKAFLTNEKQLELINLFRKKDETNR